MNTLSKLFSGQSRKTTIMIVAGLLFLIVCAQLVVRATKHDLVLRINPTDATVKINDETRSGTKFNLDTGSYDLTVTANGYLSKQTTFAVEDGKTTSLTINLVRKTPATLTERVLRDAIYQDYPNQELKVLSTEQLYGGTWILGNVLIGGEEEKVVLLQKDDSETGYQLYITGPPFDQILLPKLPADVQSAITNKSSGVSD